MWPGAEKRYVCELCCYQTDRSSSYDKHLITWKHIRKREQHKENLRFSLVCDKCGRGFKKQLWFNKHVDACGTTHKVQSGAKCTSKDSRSLDEVIDDEPESGEVCGQRQGNVATLSTASGMSNEMLMTMMEYVRESERKHGEHMEMMQRQLDEERNQCKMLMNTVQDMIPKIGNFNNNKISINIFLQEHCKDALNLKDFVDSLRIELNDVSNLHDRATIDAVGNVFVNGLRQLDLYKRPIHCMDLSRETLYIKDNGAWENDTSDKCKLSGAISAVAAKQSRVLEEWEKLHPNWCNSDELTSEYLRLVRATTSPIVRGSTTENKIIHNIAKEVVVDLSKVTQ
jgi:hypothetical protein